MNRDIYELARIIGNLDDSGIDVLIEEIKLNWPHTYWYIINELVDQES